MATTKQAASNLPTHKVILTIVAVVGALLAWQYKKSHMYLVGIGVIVIMGLLLSRYGTIKKQFQNIGNPPTYNPAFNPNPNGAQHLTFGGGKMQ